LVTGFEGIGTSALSTIIYVIGFGLIFVVALVGLWALIYFTSYPYKITVWELFGNSTNGYTIGKPKSNRAKYNKEKNAWVLMMPLFKGKEIQPFDTKCVYPGKRCYAYLVDDKLVPVQHKVNLLEHGELNPIPAYLNNWVVAELKSIEKEFNAGTFWDKYGNFMTVIVTVAICCVLVGAVIYFTYQFAGGTGADLTGAINSLAENVGMQNVIPGKDIPG